MFLTPLSTLQSSNFFLTTSFRKVQFKCQFLQEDFPEMLPTFQSPGHSSKFSKGCGYAAYGTAYNPGP